MGALADLGFKANFRLIEIALGMDNEIPIYVRDEPILAPYIDASM